MMSKATSAGKLPIEPSLDRLAHLVIGAAIEVHKRLGPGYLEAIYEQALAIELAFLGIPFERQKSIAIRYRDQLIGERISSCPLCP
jgi:GxxExxY protein